jgi:hypothetical protein
MKVPAMLLESNLAGDMFVLAFAVVCAILLMYHGKAQYRKD